MPPFYRDRARLRPSPQPARLGAGARDGLVGKRPNRSRAGDRSSADGTQSRRARPVGTFDPWHGTLRMRRTSEAERVLRRALELNPNFALAHALLAKPLAIQGAHEEAAKSAEHALRLSPPLWAYASFATTLAHFAAGRYAECIDWARNTIDRAPEYSPPYTLLIAATGMQGERPAAAEALAARLALRSDFSLAWVSNNLPFVGEVGERWLQGLRMAGVPG